MRLFLSIAGLVPVIALLPIAAAAQPILLEDIVLSANRFESEALRTGASVSTLTARDLEADGRPFALDQIRDLPGVSVQQSGPAGTVSGFAIRGAPQEYVRVEVEGIEVSDPTGTQVAASLSGLLVDDISRIEVLKGSQSALYGGQAVGGVISITAPRPAAPGLAQRFVLEAGDYATFRGAYSLAGMNDRGEFALTLARLQTDGFSAAEAADGNDEDDGYATTRVSGSGRLYVTDQTDVFASAFWQDEDGDFDAGPGVGGDAPNTFEGRNWGLRGGIAFTTERGFSNTVAASRYDVSRTQVSGFGPFITDGTRTRLEYLGTYAPAPDVALLYGADYARETSGSNFAAERSNWMAGAFVQADLTPLETVTLNAAARLDEQSEFGRYPTGRLTLAWAAAPETTLRGSLGTGFRMPSIFETVSDRDGDLGPETSVSADLGVTRSFAGGRGQAGATLFWLEIDDLIEFDDATFQYFQQGGAARSKGFELAALWEVGSLATLSGAYTFTDAELPDGSRRDRIPRHDIALRVAGTLAERIRYDLGANVVFDQYDDARVGGVLPQTSGFADNYVVLGARLAYAITDDAEVYVRGVNLLDEQYQTARGYGTSDRAFYAGVAARF